ncbi:MAG: peptide ABC transporter substrate-binding protein [Flavobacteriia bacterium]|nr:peptide ABC transporter substrate-binding protein [Flavobacteriia bacterium]
MKLLNVSTLFVLSIIYLSSCNEKINKKLSENAGGTFSMCIAEAPSSFVPRNVTDVHSQMVLNQVFEGLVTFNPEDMKVRPQIASSWKVSQDLLTYTFQIRKDIYFHPSDEFSLEERKLTLDDILFSFEKIAQKDAKGNPSAAYTSFFKGLIKGLDEYHEGKQKNISGIQMDKSKNTFSITLTHADGNFLSKLSNINASICSKKMCSLGREDRMIGTGPFCYKGIENGIIPKIVLVKNEDYYLTDKKGEALPYLNQVVFYIENKKLNELEMFENGEIVFISSLPTSRISAMLEGRLKDFNGAPPLFILRNNPLLATNYYFFNMKDKRFSNKKVRQAFNYAINKNKITQDVLKGQAYEDGIFGIVPPLSSYFRKYDFSALKNAAYQYNPVLAKKLLAEAGYPNGSGFGTVDLRINIGDLNSSVAEEIAKQIYTELGIQVNIDASSFDQKNEDANFLKGDLFRIAWFADYISPESFLTNFYGKIVPSSLNEPSMINQSRYQNPTFDNLFEKAKNEENFTEQLIWYNKAEIELMKDPPFIPLWYNGDFQIVYSKVRNFHENPLNYIYLKEVYLKEWSKSEYEEFMKKNQ